MLSLDNLQSRFSNHFSVFEPISEYVARCVRSNHGSPFAVYYIDISQRLPVSLEELDEYQDRVIATRYFDGIKSLQWSQYLYFVVAETVDSNIRSLVERDRKYARKFIVNEEELTSALTPPKFQVAEGVIDASILSTWTTHLVEANLDHVIFNSDSLPQRIKQIEANFGHKGLPKPSAVTKRRPEAPPFISTIELGKYRTCPIQRKFDFGTVTLVTGPNGTGKTSLLEALELLYCGINKRDPKSDTRYAITATFRNGKSETGRNGSPSPSELRDRNLAWYGQMDVRTNTLYQSFSRYNFLDTDAAVGLADSKADFEEDLSKLLVGPDASKTWREIERTNGELEKTLKELTSVEQQVRLELSAVERQLAAAIAVPKESDALLRTLSKTLTDAGWTIQPEELGDQVSDLISDFAVRGPILEEALTFDWIESPRTIQSLRRFIGQVEEVISGAERIAIEAQSTLNERRQYEFTLQSLDKKEEAIRELLMYIENDFVEKENRLQELDRALKDVSRLVPSKGNANFEAEDLPDLAVPLNQFHDQSMKRRKQAELAVAASQNRLSDFTKQRDQAQSLAQQLRHVASQILSSAEKPDTCPLCHAEYEKGDLGKRIVRDIDNELEIRSLQLREELIQSNAEFAAAKQATDLSEWILKWVVRIGLEQDIEIRVLKQYFTELLKQKEDLHTEFDQAKSASQQLQTTGLSLNRYAELAGIVFGHSNTQPILRETLGELLKKLAVDRTIASSMATKLQELVFDKLNELGILLGEDKPTLEKCQRSIETRKGRRDRTQSILSKLDSITDGIVILEESPLSDLNTTVKLVRKSLSEVQIAITNETKAIAVVSEATKRRLEIQQQLSVLEPRIERFREVEVVFKKILEQHSLSSAMEAALESNKSAIDEIFRRIHSPAEFSGLRDMTTLIRRNGDTAKLQQISTGQRAALALSLFLAQNTQLRSAPPLMLIDDPIAHVDDLNCLSFLDYLREVALGGERQIVFATANEKIASLFERKFDFLGSTEFVRHNLTR